MAKPDNLSTLLESAKRNLTDKHISFSSEEGKLLFGASLLREEEVLKIIKSLVRLDRGFSFPDLPRGRRREPSTKKIRSRLGREPGLNPSIKAGLRIVFILILATACSPPQPSPGGGSGAPSPPPPSGGGGGLQVPAGTTVLEATLRVASVNTNQYPNGTLVVVINGQGGDYNYYFNGGWQPIGCGNFAISQGPFTVEWYLVDGNGNPTTLVLTVAGTAQ